MKTILCVATISILLTGCGNEDADNAVTDYFGKSFNSSVEKEIYAQYVADSTAAIVDAIFENGCVTSMECTISGHRYMPDGKSDYILETTTKVTVAKSGEKLTVSAKNTNPSEQIFLKDANSDSELISVNLLDGTYSIQISGSSSPYTVTTHARYTDSQDLYGDQGLTFKVKTDSSFIFDKNRNILTSGSATTTYKDSSKYKWKVGTSGIVALN
ncbi:hypothetical protein L1D22_00540 [Vibrio sp. Isolate34]|uniref:hypothetical protein n=1 Tax=Vibrio sp. Isolate34 TaxID=2908540 RepID=UPI001EFD4231|nr:hypothetical protein [Vibrio sp. Isolate34]MCG9638440.1 hypothetical protein [Vibrio sp. Isolate34]